MNAAILASRSSANELAKLRFVQEQITILGRQDGRHGCSRQRVLDQGGDRLAFVPRKGRDVDELRRAGRRGKSK
jgi:hypothetical protein